MKQQIDNMEDRMMQQVNKLGVNLFEKNLPFILNDKKDDEDWYERPIRDIYFI